MLVQFGDALLELASNEAPYRDVRLCSGIKFFRVLEDTVLTFELDGCINYTDRTGRFSFIKLTHPFIAFYARLFESIPERGTVCRNSIYGRMRNPKYGNKLVMIVSIEDRQPVVDRVTQFFDWRCTNLLISNYCAVADHDENRVYFIAEEP